MNFCGRIFSGVYRPKDTRDEKVSSVLPRREHGEIEPLDRSRIRWIHGNSMRIPWKFHGKSVDLWRIINGSKANPFLIDTFQMPPPPKHQKIFSSPHQFPTPGQYRSLPPPPKNPPPPPMKNWTPLLHEKLYCLEWPEILCIDYNVT